MCGRFKVSRRKQEIEEAFEVESGDGELDDSSEEHALSHAAPRYNAAPGQEILAILQDANTPRRTLSLLRWGLVPRWAKDPSIGYKMINARSETVAEKPSFREPLRTRRCLIPADGFYEWRREGKAKTPFCFTLADDSLFAFAALWDEWRSPQGLLLHTCTILTTAPNALMRDVHDRMPVILPREHHDLWLDPGFSKVSELQSLLLPFPAEQMRRYRVSERVNSVKYDDAECAREVPAA